MSNIIFENYIENAFDEGGQAEFKKAEFLFNYSKYFPSDKKSPVLDIGVGKGEMLSCLKSLDFEDYLGIDISPSTISYCQKINLNCRLISDSKKWLNDSEDKYSLITLLDVLEHFDLDYAIDFLKSAHRALAADGVLIVQVPNMQAPDGHLHFYNDVTHKMGYVEHSLKQLLISSGIQKFEIREYENIVTRTLKSRIKICIRAFLRCWTRFTRVVHGNLNPKILTPVFFVVIKK